MTSPLFKEDFRTRQFALMEEHIHPGIDKTSGRPGMEMWRILVMGVVKQGLRCDFDHLRELANQHMTLRQFPGHVDIWEKHRYTYQTLVDNVSLLPPELLVAINHLFVESGHTSDEDVPTEELQKESKQFPAVSKSGH